VRGAPARRAGFRTAVRLRADRGGIAGRRWAPRDAPAHRWAAHRPGRARATPPASHAGPDTISATACAAVLAGGAFPRYSGVAAHRNLQATEVGSGVGRGTQPVGTASTMQPSHKRKCIEVQRWTTRALRTLIGWRRDRTRALTQNQNHELISFGQGRAASGDQPTPVPGLCNALILRQNRRLLIAYLACLRHTVGIVSKM